ncbi:MAG: O-antigen ligase family protein, partial [Nitriliruptorales bacterium]|nr:O-antigen ligase family protein [Nitriliruptorales bacterium]
ARRLPRWGLLVLAAWTVGLGVALGLATDRTNFVPNTLTYAIVPLVFLAASRIWRRRWGPALTLGLVLAAAGKYWQRSFLQWWGNALLDNDTRWLPLSWWNPSAVLMGMFGLLFLAFANLGRRVMAVAAGLASAALLAGVWLSASRGGLLAVVVGVVVVVAAAWRHRHRSSRSGRAVVVATVGVLAGAVVVSLLLTGMTESGGQPIAEREQRAATNALARLEHMKAAAGMFVDRPLLGHGPGSYREIAPEFTAPTANLTTEAHNQYIQVLAEGGIVFGVPFIIAMGMLAWLAVRVVRVPSPAVTYDDPVRRPAVVGAVGMVAVLLAHSAVDFDWAFPVLPVLGAVGAAILWVEAGPEGFAAKAERTMGRRLAWVAVGAAGLALCVAAGLALAYSASGNAEEVSPEELAISPVPWDAPEHARFAFLLLRDDEVDAARIAVDRGLTWNPGHDRLRIADAAVEHAEGTRTTNELVSELDHPPGWLQGYVDVAEYLVATGELDAAQRVAQRGIEEMTLRHAWGHRSLVADSHMLLIHIAAEQGGCEAARVQADVARRAPLASDLNGFEQAVDDRLEMLCSDTGMDQDVRDEP